MPQTQFKMNLALALNLISIRIYCVFATELRGRVVTMDKGVILQSNTLEAKSWKSTLLECAADCIEINCAALAISLPEDDDQRCALISSTDELSPGLWQIWKTYGEF